MADPAPPAPTRLLAGDRPGVRQPPRAQTAVDPDHARHDLRRVGGDRHDVDRRRRPAAGHRVHRAAGREERHYRSAGSRRYPGADERPQAFHRTDVPGSADDSDESRRIVGVDGAQTFRPEQGAAEAARRHPDGLRRLGRLPEPGGSAAGEGALLRRLGGANLSSRRRPRPGGGARVLRNRRRGGPIHQDQRSMVPHRRRGGTAAHGPGQRQRSAGPGHQQRHLHPDHGRGPADRRSHWRTSRTKSTPSISV